MRKYVLTCMVLVCLLFGTNLISENVCAAETTTGTKKSTEEIFAQLKENAAKKAAKEREQDEIDIPQKRLFESGKYNEVSDDYLKRKQSEAEASLASANGFLARVEEKRAPYKAEMEKIGPELKTVTENLDKAWSKTVGCFGGDKAAANAALDSGDYSKSSCSQKEFDEAYDQFRDLYLKKEDLEKEYSKAEANYKEYDGFYERANSDIEAAQKNIDKYNQAIEQKAAAVVTPPPVEEEAEPEEVDGVLPPAAAAEPAKVEAPKQEEIIGMASTAEATEAADTTNVTADTEAPKTTKTTSSSKASGALFGTLTQKAAEVFTGLREIIFAVAGFGITAVAIGGFFGNLNWKWLSAIIIGLVVISTTSAIINYMVDSDAITGEMITDTLINAR